MRPEAQLLKFLKEEILSQSTYVLTQDNIYLSESIEFLMQNDDWYPRIEIQPLSLPRVERVTQRTQTRNVTYGLQGYIRRAEDKPTTDEDSFQLFDFLCETEELITKIHNAKIAGTAGLPSEFIQIKAYSEAFMALEIEPRISTFMFNFTAEFSVCG